MEMPYSFLGKQILRTPGFALNPSIGNLSLTDFIADDFFLEALFLASPVLYAELQKFKDGKIADGKLEEKLYFSVAKYYLRMSSRCTPFGLFSGCAVLTWAENSATDVVIGNEKIDRHTRLDMHYLCALAQHLSALPFIKQKLLYRPNSSYYNISDEMRYVDYKYLNARRSHEICSVQQSEYVDKIIAAAAGGIYFKDIVALLTDDDITEQEATDFANELITEQVLVDELEPAITGEEFLSQITFVLKKIYGGTDDDLQNIIETLEKLKQLLVIADAGSGNNIAVYNEIIACIKNLNVPYEESKLFQTDSSFLLNKNTVNTSVQKDLTEALNFTNQFSEKSESPNLQSFTKRFHERFEEKEMPLLQVLDVETGIGYLENSIGDIVPLVQDIFPPSPLQTIGLKMGLKEKLLLEKLKVAHSTNKNIIHFTEKDIAAFKGNWDDGLPSVAVMYRLLEDGKIQMENAGGSSAANLLGRFAHGNKEINEVVNAITAAEEEANRDIIFAEIIHLPESRVGNILLHPTFRKYEIPFLAKSSVDIEHQISLQDLYISVKNNKIILRSGRLNKQIIPRLSSAHNYSYNALPVYQFLCDLQLQDKKGHIGFHWGPLENFYETLPRVEYKNTILAPAQWNLSKTAFEHLFKKEEQELKNLTKEFREKWNLPQYAVLADSDNELLINFEDTVMVKIFLDAIKKRPQIMLKEFFMPSHEGLVKNEQGKVFNNQVIAILLRKSASYGSALSPVKTGTPKNLVQSSFSLGTEWIYFKLYCGVKSADKILAESFAPMIRELQTTGIIDNFFFVRYTDPSFHLRVRFKVTNALHTGRLISLFAQYIGPLEASGLIWKIQTDTYKRELERYGYNTIELAEKLFYHDSVAVLEMLELTDGGARAHVRWAWAIRAIDELLNDFKFLLQDKLALITSLKTSFHTEFKSDKNLKDQLTTKYRANRKTVEDILCAGNDEGSELHLLIHVLKKKSQKNIAIADAIKQQHLNGTLQLPIAELIFSYIHMLVNRIVSSNPRLHELVLYDMLFTYYKSSVEKAKQSPRNQSVIAA